MLHITRQLYTISRSCMYIYNQTVIVCKTNFCDKKILEILEKVTKDKTSLTSKETTTNTEIENLSFANDAEILQTVITEKEKDANVRSRLSKECNTLLDKKLRLSSTGLNLHLKKNSTENTCWEDYMFDKTIDNLKKHTVAPIVEARGVSDGISQTTKQVNDGGGINRPVDRIVRQDPGKVLFAFIPVEWSQFFIPKTGVTGFGTFLFTFGIFLVSKEYYILEHNFYNGLSSLILWCGGIKYVGPHIAKYLDKEVDDYEKSWQKGRDQSKHLLEEQIEDENVMQFQADGQLMLVAAKRENVQLQLEEEFRLRQMTVYHEVLKRLNYQVAVAAVYKRIFHQNLVEYVTNEVKKSITPEMEKEMINVSISDLVHELQKK